MKRTLLLLASALFSTVAASALQPGDAVSTEVFGKLKWLQGQAPTTWEPGKIYIFECWATWCGPCIASIPHLDELHDHYAAKGLLIHGIDVWEDGADQVAAFVKNKGDGMSYPIAYTGKGGAFEEEWLKPAGVKGIPHAFVVRDGKLVISTHPKDLTEKVIDGLLAGGKAADEAIDSFRLRTERAGEIQAAMEAFRSGQKAEDGAAMEKALGDLRTLDPYNSQVPWFTLTLDLFRDDWTAATATLATLPAGPNKGLLLVIYGGTFIDRPEVPAAFLESYGQALAANVTASSTPMEWVSLARFQWRTGHRDTALESARKATERVASLKAISPAPYARFIAALEKGDLPSSTDFNAWVRETLPKAVSPAVAVPSIEVASPPIPATPATPVAPATPAPDAPVAPAAK